MGTKDDQCTSTNCYEAWPMNTVAITTYQECLVTCVQYLIPSCHAAKGYHWQCKSMRVYISVIKKFLNLKVPKYSSLHDCSCALHQCFQALIVPTREALCIPKDTYWEEYHLFVMKLIANWNSLWIPAHSKLNYAWLQFTVKGFGCTVCTDTRWGHCRWVREWMYQGVDVELTYGATIDSISSVTV